MRSLPLPLSRLLLPASLLLSALALQLSLGCGGGGGGSRAVPIVGVTVAPTSASLLAGDTKGFTATVTNAANTAVTWSVQEGAPGGSISASGLYASPTAVGTFHVIATSQADPTKSASATVVVQSLTLAPATITLPAGGTTLFHATLGAGASGGVLWSVQESAGGTVSASGLYTAPFKAGVFHVVAKRADVPALSATATITVQAGNGSGTIQ